MKQCSTYLEVVFSRVNYKSNPNRPTIITFITTVLHDVRSFQVYVHLKILV